ncbi:YraN family protein [Actinomyces ruminicola]|uniref:YraN family protein n=1 Tax=Actinomyces ruminicola TaxID=332524 RepID=UPI0011CBE92E|nr:YraN family protein [Actinomyces ruminicola]
MQPAPQAAQSSSEHGASATTSSSSRPTATPPPAPGFDAAPPAQSRRQIGQRGEDIAARYLSDLGWQILDRNWRPGPGLRGEVDLVALQPQPSGPGVLVIVEVKTRTSEVAGPPAAAVGPLKLLRLRSLAVPCAAAHPVPHAGLRLDVVSVQLRAGRPALLRHHRGVGD